MELSELEIAKKLQFSKTAVDMAIIDNLRSKTI